MKQKMLLVSCATLSAGGAERVLSVLSAPFANEYERVVYVMWQHAKVFYPIDKKVELVDIEQEVKSRSTLRKMTWFRKYVQREQPDLILSFLYPYSMRVLVALQGTSFKVVVAERRDGGVVRGGWAVKQLRNLLYRRAYSILLQTDGNRKHYGRALAAKVKVIYNPILIPQENIGLALRTVKENIVVTVGSFKPEKNHALLIHAFAEFHRLHPDYHLVIYGEGPLRGVSELLVSKLGLSDAVQLPGNTNDVFVNIARARMFVLSSDLEGMPNALIEAMCVGLPCISTKVSGATELIQTGENGVLVNVGNQANLVSAMNLLADNHNYAQLLAERAVDVYQVTNAAHICQQWIEYINSKI